MPNFITDPILENYAIQLDDYCYAVQKNVTPENKGGKVYQKTLGYFSSFEAALKAVVKDMCHQENYNSIDNYIQKWKDLQSSFETKFKVSL